MNYVIKFKERRKYGVFANIIKDNMAHIQFYYPKRLAFSPADFEYPGLGGTESSIVLLSKALAARGHRVEVFCACWKPGVYDGVTWRGAWEIENTPLPDIMIHVRTKSSVIERKAKTNIFWMLDDRADGAIFFSEQYPKSQVVLASDTMKGRLQAAGFSGNITKIHLPIETERFENGVLPSTSKICLHTSMPNRGLVELLKFWPQIKEKVPDAQLIATSGWELWGYTKEEAADRLRQTIGTDIVKDSVIFTGVLPRQEFIDLVKKARIGVFPSFFPEMYCLAAAEIAVSGRPIIVSKLDALSERVDNNVTGYSITGDIRSKEVQQQFVEKIVYLLNNDKLVDEMGAAAIKQRADVACNIVASNWEKIF